LQGPIEVDRDATDHALAAERLPVAHWVTQLASLRVGEEQVKRFGGPAGPERREVVANDERRQAGIKESAEDLAAGTEGLEQGSVVAARVLPGRARGMWEDHGKSRAGQTDDLGQGISVEPPDVDEEPQKSPIADAQAATLDLLPAEKRGRDPEGRVTLGLAGHNDMPHLPAIPGTRSPIGVGDAVEPAVVLIGQIYGQARLGPPQLQERRDSLEVSVEGRELGGKGGVGPHVHRGVKLVPTTRPVERHAMPDDLVDTLGEQRIGQQLPVLEAESRELLIELAQNRLGETVPELGSQSRRVWTSNESQNRADLDPRSPPANAGIMASA